MRMKAKDSTLSDQVSFRDFVCHREWIIPSNCMILMVMDYVAGMGMDILLAE